MANALGIVGLMAVLFAVFYQMQLKNILFTLAGVGRVMQPIEDFPYTCRRIHHPHLEGCEDMWIDDDARVLYAACSTTNTRLGWSPA
jgi:hypothetical protein